MGVEISHAYVSCSSSTYATPPSSANLLEAATEWARLHEGEARSPNGVAK